MKKKIVPITEEQWYDIKRGRVKENYYQVSNFGNLRNIKGQEILPIKINSGYLLYRLGTGIPNAKTCKDKCTRVLAHRLVMETIHPVDGMENLIVNHKDHVKTHNYDENLEWMTHAENNIDSLDYHKNYGEKRIDTKFNNDQLKIIDKELQKGTCYKEILSMIGMEDTWNNRDLIGNIKRGLTYQRAIRDLRNE